MTTGRGSQYSIQSNGGGLRSRADPSKGKRKGKIPSGTQSTQGSAISKGKVPDMPMISEPALELIQAVLHGVQEMLPQIHQGVMNSWNILKKFLKEEEIVRYSNGWNPLSSKPQIKKIKEYHAKRKDASKEEAPVASTSKPQAN
ncbi:hypothetical protein O181_086960 [Austropuccinia psidii MF-1]|uniref:Uncharacterized protein n=1 Tax=Austropuccinia psidii MF-1 TaxID=1389203 RepID=A0A9Q3INS2_9BASI|nr:hypothetical protein [Austropuccinia psidii MF-1]